MLRSEGYIVDTAGTLAQPRRHLQSLRYALVNTDLRLPDGDGLEIVDRAAELGARTSILSGYVFQLPSDAADRHEVLMKPMRPVGADARIEWSYRTGGLASYCRASPADE